MSINKMTDEEREAKRAQMMQQFPELFEGMQVPEAPAPEPEPEPEPEAPAPVEVAHTSGVQALAQALADQNHTKTETELVAAEAEQTHTNAIAANPAPVTPETPETPNPEPAPGVQGPGFVVFWSVQGGSQRATVESQLGASDPDVAKHFPAAPSAIAALQRAKQSVAGKFGRVVFRSLDRGSVAVVSEAEKTAGELDYSHGLTLTVPGAADTKTALTVSNYHESAGDCLEAANALSKAYHEHRDIVGAADLSAWLTACADDMQAVSLRPRGGVYFVPRKHGARLMQLKAAGDAIGCAQVYVMALATDGDTADAVAGATAEAFLGDFRAIERDVADWTSGIQDAKRPGRGFNALGEQLKTLKDRVFMFREVLSAQESRLTEVISGAESALRSTFDKHTQTKQTKQTTKTTPKTESTEPATETKQ